MRVLTTALKPNKTIMDTNRTIIPQSLRRRMWKLRLTASQMLKILLTSNARELPHKSVMARSTHLASHTTLMKKSLSQTLRVKPVSKVQCLMDKMH